MTVYTSCANKGQDPMAVQESTPASALRKSANPSNVVSQGGRLRFTHQTAFEAELSRIEDEAQALAFERSFTGYTSYRLHHQNTTGRPDTLDVVELTAAINPDRIVQTGPWIFRFDFSQRKLYTIHQSDEATLFEDLRTGNLQDQRLMMFDFDDEVFAILDEGVRTRAEVEAKISGWFCRRGCPTLRKATQEFSVADSPRYVTFAESRYRKHGIWFTFFTIEYGCVGLRTTALYNPKRRKLPFR